MTPNTDPSRNLAFWRMEVNRDYADLNPTLRERIAVEALRLHMSYTGPGVGYGTLAARDNVERGGPAFRPDDAD